MRLPTAFAKLNEADIAALFWNPPDPMNTATECGPYWSMIRRNSLATWASASGIGVETNSPASLRTSEWCSRFSELCESGSSRPFMQV